MPAQSGSDFSMLDLGWQQVTRCLKATNELAHVLKGALLILNLGPPDLGWQWAGTFREATGELAKA